MSTQPPKSQSQTLSTGNNVTMAVAQAKPKPASKPAAAPKSKMQMHRRSRTGCYTCRLRRKKCDEGAPYCSACKHLGLRCEYKRPMWWSNNDQRRIQKDQIKMIIKRKKLSEKTSNVLTPSSDTTPGLSHSLPTSATYSDPISRPRSASIESQYTLDFDFNAPPAIADYSTYGAPMHQHGHFAPVYPEFAPYDIDVKTERQMFVNDIPTRRESTISTFSSFHALPESLIPNFPVEREWSEEFTEEPLDMGYFDFAHGPVSTPHQLSLDLDDQDRLLLDHFIAEILPSIFPIMEANQQGIVRSDLVLPALENNKCYLHCCLSIAAQHLKLRGYQDGQIDNDILRHRYATVSELCAALNRDEDHQQILDAALGMCFFQCSVGRTDDSLPDIAWHQHFQAAVNIALKLELPRTVTDLTTMDGTIPQTPFSMSLTAWIDILGATMLGRSPVLAHTYREKHLTTLPGSYSLGLRELMGCDDRVMYLISEIACLESLKRDGMDDIQLCQHVHSLGDQIGLTEVQDGGAGAAAPKIPFNGNGVLNPRQLSRNITAAFRLAARIYLCSLVPGFSPSQGSCIGLVEKLASVLEFIPSGAGGYDRSLVWVYLIGGSMALPNSNFRALFNERVMALGELADVGSFGRVACLLNEVWALIDSQIHCASPRDGQPEHEIQAVSWRDVMQSKGWDFLLI